MKKFIGVFILGIALQLTLNAQEYVLKKTIPLTGDGGYDYLAIDHVNNHLFVSHNTVVHVIDLSTEKECGKIAGLKGSHGIAFVNKYNKGFITDGEANAVICFDLKTYKVISTISFVGKGPDAITYDAFSDRVFAFCGDSKEAYAINPKTLKIINSVSLKGVPEFAVADNKGFIYNNLEDEGALAVINTKQIRLIRKVSLSPCGGPTGLAIDRQSNLLFSVCRENKGMSVFDITSNQVTQTIPIGAGVDAVAYDDKTKLIFCSNGDGTTTIIKQLSKTEYKVLQTLKTPQHARTLALNSKTHDIYLSSADFQPGTRTSIPATFKVSVFKLK